MIRIQDMAKFPDKIKVLRFVGIGEPLLHKQIAEMVEYAAQANIASTIEILTNGTKLTPEMSIRLASSGLNRLVVSLQGLNNQKIREVAGVDIDIDELNSNLKYFYQNRQDVHVYIKIVDTALDQDNNNEAKFYEMYDDICDSIAIEHMVPIHSGVEFEDNIKDESKTQFGLPLSDIQVCPQPFFHMQINPDGNVVPCYSFEYPDIMGNVNNQAVNDIWTNKKFQTFRRKMLDGIKNISSTCAECSIIHYRLFQEDVLDHKVDELKSHY